MRGRGLELSTNERRGEGGEALTLPGDLGTGAARLERREIINLCSRNVIQHYIAIIIQTLNNNPSSSHRKHEHSLLTQTPDTGLCCLWPFILCLADEY